MCTGFYWRFQNREIPLPAVCHFVLCIHKEEECKEGRGRGEMGGLCLSLCVCVCLFSADGDRGGLTSHPAGGFVVRSQGSGVNSTSLNNVLWRCPQPSPSITHHTHGSLLRVCRGSMWEHVCVCVRDCVICLCVLERQKSKQNPLSVHAEKV